MTNVLAFSKQKKGQRHHSILAENLSLLMKEKNITEAELARGTGISQQLCNHILTGRTLSPKIETIITLSEFLKITVGQLVGAEPLHIGNKQRSFSVIPLLAGSDIIHWVKDGVISQKKDTTWISCDLDPSLRTYAIKLDASHEPLYDKNSILIVKVTDDYIPNMHVIVSFDGSSISIRTYAVDRTNIYLRPILSGLPTVQLKKTYHLLGTVIETRIPNQQQLEHPF